MEEAKAAPKKIDCTNLEQKLEELFPELEVN